MQIKDKVNKRLKWQTDYKMKGTVNNNINNDDLVQCSGCDEKVILVKTKAEYELLTEILKSNPLEIEVDFAEETEAALLKRIKKLGLPLKYDNKYFRLPAKCTFNLEFMTSKEGERIVGTYTIELRKTLMDRSPSLKEKCPRCNHNVFTAADDYIALQEKEYSKLVSKYKYKEKDIIASVDPAKINVQNYLGIVTDLYKDSIILEKQIKDLIFRKLSYQRTMAYNEKCFIRENKEKIKTEINSIQQKIDAIQPDDIELTPVEKGRAWNEFISEYPEWGVSPEKIVPPKNPSRPLPPTRPFNKPRKVVFERTRPIPPQEPVYGVPGLFNKKKINRQNDELKQKYEKDIAVYQCDCREYDEAKREYKIASEKYEQNMIAYEAAMKEYEKKYDEYKAEEQEYLRNKAILEKEYKLKLAQQEEQRIQTEEKKKEVYGIALQQKRDEKTQEKEKLEKQLKTKDKESTEKIEAKAKEIPGVVKYSSLVEFLNNEIKQLGKDLFNVYQTIDLLKEVNVIYPKYFQFTTLCSLYEYYISGRVTELTGPHGAYNIYENEIRSDIIINKLDMIINNLDDIKNSQVFLYGKMCEINAGINNFNGKIDKLAAEITAIEETPRVSISFNTLLDFSSYSNYSDCICNQRTSIENNIGRANALI